MPDLMLGFAVLWGINAGVGALLGLLKGRVAEGAGLGFLLGPIGWALIVWLLEDYRPRCPACLSVVNVGSRRCPRCQTDFAAPAAQKTAPPLTSRQVWLVATLFVVAIIALPVLYAAITERQMGALARAGWLMFGLILLCLPPAPWIMDRLKSQRQVPPAQEKQPPPGRLL